MMHRRLAFAAFGLLGVSAAAAAELPTRKAGLWDVKMTVEGQGLPPHTMQQCVDAQTDKLMNSGTAGLSRETCSKKEVKISGSTITMDSVCQSGGATTTSHAVITGSFDQAYTIRISSTRQGGAPVPGTTPGQATNMTIEAKWLGACKAGQKPGDIIMANGMKMNVLEMPAMMPGGGPPGRPPGPPR